MHQPLAVTDEEGVRLINGEVVHGLVGIFDDHHRLDHAVVTIQGEDHLARLEVCRVNPHDVVGVEGMLRRGFDQSTWLMVWESILLLEAKASS